MRKKLKQLNMVILIYARLSSKRLPNKVLCKINSKPLLSIVIDRIKKISSYKIPIIVISSKHDSDNKLENYCINKKINFFRGDLGNVFNRTLQCSKIYNFKSFIRVCADRPFFDVRLMDKMIKKFKEKRYEIVTNQFPRTYPKGLACEISDINIFRKLNQKKLNHSDKEHIFNFFYRNSKNYNIFNFSLKNSKKIRNIDYSLNNKKDLLKIRKIYNIFSSSKYIDILEIKKKNESIKYT
jgi:spore coat polysaccharide biosynthesis protein SpsF (cytidylyltransferase family)